MLELGEKLGAYKQNSEYEFHNHCHQLSLEHERALQCQKDEITTLKLTLKVRPVTPLQFTLGKSCGREIGTI